MHRPIRFCSALPSAALLSALCVFALGSRVDARQSTPLADARLARDSGDFATAARLLRTHLQAQPDDGEAARLLGETLYWLHDIPGARSVYERALEQHPQDTTVRLQYARMLAETGDAGRARELLLPLGEVPAVRARADTLLGTIAYWQGDLTSARRLFEQALQADAGQVEAARQLREIRTMTRPWLRIGPGRRADDQPLDRLGLDMEAGWFVTPLSPVTVRVEARDYDTRTGSDTRADSRRRFWNAEIAMTRFHPALRLDTEIRGGLHRRPDGESPGSWYGSLGAGVRLPGHVRVRARLERTPYLYTITSLDTLVLPRASTVLAEWQHPRGWSAEGAYGQQRHGDGNRVTSAYTWALAPVVFRPRVQLKAGYAFAREHSDESRFVLAHPVQAVPPSDARFDTAGRYVPYYTPNRLESHSAVFSGVATSRGGVVFRANGTVGIRATDEHPVLYVSGTEVLRTFYARTFRPRDLSASIEVPAGNAAVLSISGAAGRSAFYSWSNLGVHLTYRFRTPAAVSAGR